MNPQSIHEDDEYFKDFVVNADLFAFLFVRSNLSMMKLNIVNNADIDNRGIHSIGDTCTCEDITLM